MSLAEVPSQDEFALVVIRKLADGSYEAVAIVDDDALLERALRRAA